MDAGWLVESKYRVERADGLDGITSTSTIAEQTVSNVRALARSLAGQFAPITATIDDQSAEQPSLLAQLSHPLRLSGPLLKLLLRFDGERGGESDRVGQNMLYNYSIDVSFSTIENNRSYIRARCTDSSE